MRRGIVLFIIGSMLLAGCGGKSNDSKAAKARLAPQNEFEASGDPPINAETRFAAGQLAEANNDLKGAMAQYQEALRISPNHKDTLYRVGHLYTQQRQFPEAIATWQRYIQATGGAPQAYNNLGYCYERAGQTNEAAQAYITGLKRDPGDPGCRVSYGLLLVRQGQVEPGTAQLRSVLKPAEISYQLGMVAQSQGKIPEAKAHYEKALQMDPSLADARKRLDALK